MELSRIPRQNIWFHRQVLRPLQREFAVLLQKQSEMKSSQSEELLVSDPLALRHILVKDVAAFEEPRYFVM